MALGPEDFAQLRRQRWWSRALSRPLWYLLAQAVRWRYRYTFSDLSAFREDIWKKLDAHDGPIIWAANHLTLIDSFLIFMAVVPPERLRRADLLPWSTPDYTNYYTVGGFIGNRLIRLLMYLCRCIPFLRGGEDEASKIWRQKAFEKCVWILKQGGAVFIYPEAGRSRSGWLEPHRPKDFMGGLALEAPNAKFLCVYLRGDAQSCATAYPRPGDTLRMKADLIPAVLPGETTPRQVSQRLFNRLAVLQDSWFAGSGLRKNCGGNGVLDLKRALKLEHFDLTKGGADSRRLERCLTPREFDYLRAKAPRDVRMSFLKIFVAKAAARKALALSGIGAGVAAFRVLEVDLFRHKAIHRPSGAELDIRFTDVDEDKIHCLAVLRGGYIGDPAMSGDFLWRVEEVPAGRAAPEYARERCLELIAESNDEIGDASKLAFREEGGAPIVLHGGKRCDWGVSLSHSGRYAAYSFMIS